jgi:phosphate acetyltransferase
MDPRVRAILESGAMGSVFRAPVLLAREPLQEVLASLRGLEGGDVLPSSAGKIERAKTLFARHVDGEALAAALQAPPASQRQTPKAFMHTLQRRCTESRQRIVLPEGTEPRVLHAAEQITRRGLADIVLLGPEEDIKAEADKLGADISNCTIEDPATSPRQQKYVDLLCEARKHKGTTSDMARDMLEDVNYWGTLAVAAGDADGMVSGAVHTTAATIRPGMQVLRSKAIPLVSSVFFMCLPDRVLVYGDCAVNVSPSAKDLAHIAIASADTAAAFGVDPPRVAMLSYSTGASGRGAEVEKVKEAVALVKEQRPDLSVEGPLQYDAAVDPAVAAVKIKGDSDVAGRANVLIFPDLNSANNTYKAVQQSTGGMAIGPIMQGLRLPVNDLSRGCTVPDIVNTVVCTAVQALAARQQGA